MAGMSFREQVEYWRKRAQTAEGMPNAMASAAADAQAQRDELRNVTSMLARGVNDSACKSAGLHFALTEARRVLMMYRNYRYTVIGGYVAGVVVAYMMAGTVAALYALAIMLTIDTALHTTMLISANTKSMIDDALSGRAGEAINAHVHQAEERARNAEAKVDNWLDTVCPKVGTHVTITRMGNDTYRYEVTRADGVRMRAPLATLALQALAEAATAHAEAVTAAPEACAEGQAAEDASDEDEAGNVVVMSRKP